jgi:hypothetical protein
MHLTCIPRRPLVNSLVQSNPVLRVLGIRIFRDRTERILLKCFCRLRYADLSELNPSHRHQMPWWGIVCTLFQGDIIIHLCLISTKE